MRKIIATMNMTFDGYCDHTAGIADDELHEHFNTVLQNAGALVYGRTTYQLMESFWPTLVENPSGNKSEDEFALLIDNVQKIVYSRTLKNVTWKNSDLKHEIRKEEILKLKNTPGKDIFLGSPSIINQFMRLNLVDEYHIAVHPVIVGSGLTLFKDVAERMVLTLKNTKTLASGVVIFYYSA